MPPRKFNPAHDRTHRLKTFGLKLLWLVGMGLLLGFCYEWAVPRLYRPDTRAGFWLGTTHGFLMPAALPNLLAGQDVPIFTDHNSGRTYKLGYIAGINLCGLVFFGMTFRTPKEKISQTPPPPPQ